MGPLVFAHGIGGSEDLPISLPLALAGGSAALTVSFTVLVLAWRRPRYDAATQGRPVPAGLARVLDSTGLLVVLRTLGLLFAAYVSWAAVAGPDNLANPTFGVVYVWLWVGLVPLSLLLGPVLRAMSPVRALHALVSRASGGEAGSGSSGIVALPRWVGLWPAALGLFAFVWLELVYPESNYLSTIRIWFALYVAVMLVGGAVFGDRWFAAADPFEAYSTLVAHLSPWGRRADGVLVWRSPLANLDGVPVVPGLAAVTAVLLGSTAWDSFSSSVAWIRFTQEAGDGLVWLDTLGLLGFCLAVGALFGGATWVMANREHATYGSGAATANVFAHSLVPIVVGYIVAHYLSYLVEFGQQTLVYLSDPMVDGSNLLGTADLQVGYWLTSHPTLLATIKVLAIVGGHVLGVVSSHDRALQLLPRERQLTGQLPLLVVMVCFTLGGLYLLLTV